MAKDYARSRSSRRNARIGEVTPRGGRRPSGQRRLTAYRQPRGSRSFLWLISGILMGLLIAGGFYIKTCRHSEEVTSAPKVTQNIKASKHPTQNKQGDKSASNSVESSDDNTEAALADEDSEISELAADNHTKLNASKAGKKHAESDKPHYDFYTMLPKDAVETPRNAEKDKDIDKNKAKDKPQNKNASTGHYQLQVASFTKLEDADHFKAELILQGYSASIHKQQREGVVRYRVNIGPFKSSKAAVAQQQNLAKNKIKSIVLPL